MNPSKLKFEGLPKYMKVVDSNAKKHTLDIQIIKRKAWPMFYDLYKQLSHDKMFLIKVTIFIATVFGFIKFLFSPNLQIRQEVVQENLSKKKKK